MTTVYKLLLRSLAINIADQLKQHSVVIVLDQAIYGKACAIVWKCRDLFNRVVLVMGGFHTSMVFLAIIGKRFADAGLQDLMVESGIVGPSSVAAVLAGKHYNRGVRAHQIIMEGLIRLLWKSFEQWLQTQEGNFLNETCDLHAAVKMFRQKNFTQEAYLELIHSQQFAALHEAFHQFCASLQSPVARLWLSYTEMVQLLLLFIRSMRTADWQLHLHCIRKMLPFMFAYDHVNYSRFLSKFWCDMTVLKDTNPEAHEQLQNGAFCVPSGAKCHSARLVLTKSSSKHSTVNQKQEVESSAPV